jgi:hypothetical protein
MPKKGTKSAKKVSRAMREVFTNKPKTATKKGGRKQLIAIGLAKARKRGARIPKKRG